MEKDISYSQLGTRLGLTRQTVSTKFKNLISLGLIVEDTERKRYILKELDQTTGSLIPFKTLKVLNNTLSHNAISTYVYLLNRFIAAGEMPYVVTLKQVKEFIGIAASTSSNDEIVTDIFQFVDENQIHIYADLLRYCANDKPEWLEVLLTYAGQVVKDYIRSEAYDFKDKNPNRHYNRFYFD